MVLIAVSRMEVIHRLAEPTDAYSLITVWPYNSFFTCRVDVMPLAEPDQVIAVMLARLDSLADVVRFEWIENLNSKYAYMCVWITSNANTSVS